jgi:hypothetical protein
MYEPEIIIEPFWAENSGFLTGRDPLGIQNSSISVYARLLPGLTNLTQRLRYYGFYCWLLKEYDAFNPKETIKNLNHQYNFIRRAELIIAFLMANEYPSEGSVVGSNHANKHINDEVYNIKLGTEKIPDIEKQDIYWDFESGALGQYYAGSLINLNLIEIINKFFHIKERGLNLALAFEKSIKLDERQNFLTLIQRETISKFDLALIKSFCLNLIPFRSEEWNFYKEMLLVNDGENYKTSDGNISNKRKQTIELYLKYLQQNTENIKFDTWVYREINKDAITNTAFFGWYYYYINEAFHFALETIFWGMLVCLEGRIIPINEYIDEIRSLIVNINCKSLEINQNDLLEDVIILMNNFNLIEKINELEKLTQSEINWETAIAKAVELLTVIYVNIESNHNKIRDFENLNYIEFQKGKVTELTYTYIKNNLSISYSSYVKRIIKLIVNDHVSTAFRKMGNGEANLLKFIIEDNIIGHFQTMPPKHTNPRIFTLNKFLVDLNIIDNESQLTSYANQIFK